MKCTKYNNARAQPLFCSLNLLLSDVREAVAVVVSLNSQLTIRPVARKGYGSIAHEAKPHGLLTRGS